MNGLAASPTATLGERVDVDEVVRAALDPAGVARRDEVAHLIGGDGEHAGQVPPRQGEDARLPGVVLGQQQVGVADVGHIVSVISSSVVKPCAAAITDAVVQAIPFCVKTRL